MTGFCGTFIRDPNSRQANSHHITGKLNIAKNILSRNPRDRIQTYEDSTAFIVFFDNGAFEPDRRLEDNGVVAACISGDPILTDSDGVRNDPRASAMNVLAAIAENENDILAQTVGSFVAASLNRKTHSLILCADKLALRPLYFYLDPDVCIFSTSLRVLRSLITNLEIDDHGFAETIYINMPLAERTNYKNVYLLRPGEHLTVGPTEVHSKIYFDWGAIEPRSGDTPEICDVLYKAFIRAIRRRSRAPVENAFLSGGLDSRCVAAGLLDVGREVRTLGSSYAGSADDVIGTMVASSFGTTHFLHHRSAAEHLGKRTNFAMIARDYFPALSPSGARTVWSGAGGSFGLGHVYIDEQKVKWTEGPITDSLVYKLFKRLRARPTRLIGRRTAERMRILALTGLREALEALNPRCPDRRLYLFYLIQKQPRHNYEHYEEIDQSAVELVCPFFDSDFLAAVVASPTKMFLGHQLYNQWLTRFKTPAAGVPWQAYPTHEPGPHPMPQHITEQWTADWYKGADARRVTESIAAIMLRSNDARLWKNLSRFYVTCLRALNRFGLERYNQEIWLARRLYQAITGQSVH